MHQVLPSTLSNVVTIARYVSPVGEEDFSNYLTWLGESSAKFGMEIHAYVLMTNHVHILATPGGGESISKTMQSLGRQYVRYFNDSYRRSGTLWEGRYKSCPGLSASRPMMSTFDWVDPRRSDESATDRCSRGMRMAVWSKTFVMPSTKNWRWVPIDSKTK